MLFGRKKPESWPEKLRVMLWPRRSWMRSTKYLAKRVLRLTASPHAISAGVAAGVFASFTPFIGFHFLIAFFVAYFIAGNFIAAASGTFGLKLVHQALNEHGFRHVLWKSADVPLYLGINLQSRKFYPVWPNPKRRSR